MSASKLVRFLALKNNSSRLSAGIVAKPSTHACYNNWFSPHPTTC